MSTTYNPDNTNNPTSYQVPDDGDLADVASILAICEGVADKAAHILEGTGTEFTGAKTFVDNVTAQQDVNVEGALTVEVGATLVVNGLTDINDDVDITGDLTVSGNTVLDTGILNVLNPTVNILATGWAFDGADPSYTRPIEPGWSFDPGTGAMKWPITPTIGVGGETQRWLISGLPNGCVLTSVACRIDPANDADPTTKFRIRLLRTALDGSGTSTVSTVEDPATGGSYQAAHLFTATFTHTIDLTTYSYSIELIGESGGDEDAVTLLAPPLLTFSPPGPDWARG